MKYEKPEFEVIVLKILDVVRTSDSTPTLNPLPSNPGEELDGDF